MLYNLQAPLKDNSPWKKHFLYNWVFFTRKGDVWSLCTIQIELHINWSKDEKKGIQTLQLQDPYYPVLANIICFISGKYLYKLFMFGINVKSAVQAECIVH